MTDLIFGASLADCWLVLDCDTGYPTMYNFSTTLFLANAHPHYLIIYLPTCTICVCLLPNVLLTHHVFDVPHTITPPPDHHCHLW